MTAVEWLEKQLTDAPYIHFGDLFVQAKEMEKQQIIDAFYQCGRDNFEHIKVINRSATDYYNETYGSKGSDAPQDAPQVTPQVTSSQTEISDESWEGCDGCTEQDEVMYKNGYVKGYNAAISELPKEISDDEIFYQKQVINPYPTGEQSYTAYEKGFMDCAKWYREQLKNK